MRSPPTTAVILRPRPPTIPASMCRIRVCGKGVKAGTDLGTKLCFGTIAQTICEYLEVDASTLDGKSVWQEIRA